MRFFQLLGGQFRVKNARAIPSNTSIRGLLGDDRYARAVLDFLVVGTVKEGALDRGYSFFAAGSGSP